jgi:hypothetical protein
LLTHPALSFCTAVTSSPDGFTYAPYSSGFARHFLARGA